MNDRTFDRNRPSAELGDGPRPASVIDAAGMIWSHANPAELYRWISRRNDLLQTIAVAVPPTWQRPMAG